MDFKHCLYVKRLFIETSVKFVYEKIKVQVLDHDGLVNMTEQHSLQKIYDWDILHSASWEFVRK